MPFIKRSAHFFHPLVYWGMALYFILTFPVLSLGDKVIDLLIPEDHYFEYVGAASLFIASVLFFYCFLRSLRTDARGKIIWLKRLVYLGLALLFFFGAGEEISWGQRILGFSTPVQLAQVNSQQEFNFHNLDIFFRTNFFTVDRLFDIFWFLFAVIVPAVTLVFPRLKNPAIRLMPVVPWGLGLLFLWDYLLAKAAKALFAAKYTYGPIEFVQAVQEIKESNYAILFILAGMFAIWEMRRQAENGNE